MKLFNSIAAAAVIGASVFAVAPEAKANYWLDYLKIKTEDIIRPRIEKYRGLYYFARKIKRIF